MRSKFVRVVAEMLVVFAGVYAAFALDEYRSKRHTDEKKHQILAALEKDFSASQQTFDEATPQLVVILDSILTSYDAGGKPEIGHLAANISFRSGTWDAVLASGGVEILDIDLIVAVEAYYENVEALVAATEEGRRLSADLILPVVDQGNSVFYEQESGKLKKKFRWYMTLLREYHSRILAITDQNREILQAVRDRLNG